MARSIPGSDAANRQFQGMIRGANYEINQSNSNKDFYNPKDRRKIKPIDAPPSYHEPKNPRRADGSAIDQRQMRPDGWPYGASHDRTGSANTHGEWQPGEFERSYPPSDPKNADWYKYHHLQKHDVRFVPNTYPEKGGAGNKPAPKIPYKGAKPVPDAAKAVAKAAGKGKK
jgi:hypothetical protein